MKDWVIPILVCIPITAALFAVRAAKSADQRSVAGAATPATDRCRKEIHDQCDWWPLMINRPGADVDCREKWANYLSSKAAGADATGFADAKDAPRCSPFDLKSFELGFCPDYQLCQREIQEPQ